MAGSQSALPRVYQTPLPLVALRRKPPKILITQKTSLSRRHAAVSAAEELLSRKDRKKWKAVMKHPLLPHAKFAKFAK